MSPFEHTRDDGAEVSLTGPRWRLEIRRDGKLDAVPQEWLPEHTSGARLVTLRKIAEPMVFPDSLVNDVRRAVECREQRVPVFVKQLGRKPMAESGRAPLRLKHRKGADPSEWPEDLRVREMPEVRHA